jgi:alpha-beta hydrolase superfamily lysophospholipase
MDFSNLAQKINNYQPDGRRNVVRPRRRWEDSYWDGTSCSSTIIDLGSRWMANFTPRPPVPIEAGWAPELARALIWKWTLFARAAMEPCNRLCDMEGVALTEQHRYSAHGGIMKMWWKWKAARPEFQLFCVPVWRNSMAGNTPWPTITFAGLYKKRRRFNDC